MKIYPVLYTMILVPTMATAWADIGMGRPSPALVNLPRHGVYHSDLLASNAVHAVFKGLRSIPVVDLAVPSPATEEIAVFEVKQNLAHRRYDRMGDAALNVGKLFPVSLAADVPGQDADVGRQIREMKPGDEALLNIDHIYLFREEGNESVRAVTRFAKVQQPQPTNQQSTPAAESADAPSADPVPPAPPAEPAPLTSSSLINDTISVPVKAQHYSVETTYTAEPDGKGGIKRRKVSVVRQSDDSGKETVRKYINNVEVDPNTDQPLTPATSATPEN